MSDLCPVTVQIGILGLLKVSLFLCLILLFICYLLPKWDFETEKRLRLIGNMINFHFHI